MQFQTLKLINEILTDAGINYAFQTMNKGSVSYPYWVGEFTEQPPDTQTGYRRSNFILTGTGNGTWTELKMQKETIEGLFKDRRTILGNGSAVAFFVENAISIPTQLDKIKRVQVNITVMEWRNN